MEVIFLHVPEFSQLRWLPRVTLLKWFFFYSVKFLAIIL